MTNYNLLLIQIFSYSTITMFLGFALFQYVANFIKGNFFYKTREEILKIITASFLNFLFLTIRTFLVVYGASGMFVCFLHTLEVFLDLYIYFLIFHLFYFIRKQDEMKKCTGKTFITMFVDLFIWILIAFAVTLTAFNGNGSFDFIQNLVTFYLIPQSFLILGIYFVIPKGIKTFKEIKISFLFLSIVFVAQFLSRNIPGIATTFFVMEIIYTAKFVLFSFIAYNFYRMTMLPSEKEKEMIQDNTMNGCIDED